MSGSGNGRPERGSSFYLGFLFLSRRRREALSAVYAYCRRVDDIVDSGELSADEARRELDAWREEVERMYAGAPSREISRRLLPFLGEFSLPREGFTGLIDGMAMDLASRRYETFEDLKSYLFGAAGTVGLLCVNIFGFRRTSAEDIRAYALEMGNAMQLTNILRDVGADLERGRVYLPMEDIRAAGYSIEELMAREFTPAFAGLMERESERARGFFRKARGILHPEDRAAMLPAEVMAAIYEDVLERIRAEGYRVFFHKVRVPAWRKALLAAKAWASTRNRSGACH